MKHTLVWAALALAALSSAGQEPGRVGAVWDAVQERLSHQTDVWFHEGDYPRTVQLLRIHYSIDPSNYETGTNLGFMLENIDLYDEALAVYIQLRTSNPNEPDDAWPEAYFYYKKKAYAKVPPILEPTIKGHDPHPNNYRTLAHSYEKMNMLADARRVWELYLSKHPKDLTAKANLDRVVKKLQGGGNVKR